VLPETKSWFATLPDKLSITSWQKANIESVSLQPGIYIVRAGNKTAKIAVN